MYDIFFVSDSNQEAFQKLKLKYPRAQLVNAKSFDDVKRKSFTKMFWVVWDDLDFDLDFDLDSYRATKWDDMYVHVFKNGDFFDGICLFPKTLEISSREWNTRFFTDKKEVNTLASRPKEFERFYVNDYEDYLNACDQSATDMFWMIWPDLKINDSFDFKFQVPRYDQKVPHIFKNGDHFDGISLMPKSNIVSRKEVNHRYYIEKKEVNIVASFPCRYEHFILRSYDDYQLALKNASDMFWGQWANTVVIDESIFDLYFHHQNSYDRNENHVFLNRCNDVESYRTGLVLFSKNKPISKKEFDQRYLIDKKEHKVVATKSAYPRHTLTSYEKYLELLDKETDMFWGIWNNIDVIDDSHMDLYFDQYDGRYDHDRKENHVFKNLCNDTESYLNGVILFSKHKPISKKEFDRKYLIDKKEHDNVISRFRYPKMQLTDYDDYKKFLEEASADMFWGIWNNVDIIDETVFDLFYDPKDGRYDHDRKENHVFLNACNNETSYLNGIILFSKYKLISKKEFDRKYLIDKKEHDSVASRFRYPVYTIDSYDRYKTVFDSVDSDMFWCVWPEIEITDTDIFDLYFDPRNGKYDFDRNINHVFKHQLRADTETYNGLVLFSRKTPISKKEIEFRYIINKKEHEKIVSKHREYDIIFISYNEPNADKNWESLLSRFPRAKRVHGVKGIHNAHIAAAGIAQTDMFYVVDGDALVEDNFTFDYTCSGYERKTVHVWRSRNPINNLEYGYGGIKLLPRVLTLNMKTDTADMTTSISEQFKVMSEVSNVTDFNTDPFNTWKSAFRECVKLSSKTISRQNDKETEERLQIWTTTGQEKPFGEYAIRGAKEGIEFGTAYKDDVEMLSKINDFDWLKERYGI